MRQRRYLRWNHIVLRVRGTGTLVHNPFFPYSLYHQAFQDPPCRHRRCRVNTPPSSMQVHFVKARIHFAVYPRTCPYRRCKITSNPPNRPIWFVDAQLWFADAAFCISNTQHLLKIASISALFPQKPCTIQINALPLQHQNPPSLSTMLKWAGRFCFYRYMATKIPFIKTYSTPQELWSKKQKPVLVF